MSMSVSVSDAALRALMYFVVPLWLASGFADWLCHRKAHIELSGGPRESGLHLLMLGESAIPVLAALFLEVNAGVLLIALAGLALHQATAMIDVRFASTVRSIDPLEQHVHSFLEIVPLMAVVLLSVLHPGQLLSVLGLGGETPDFRFRLKSEPLPKTYVVTLLSAVALFEALPFCEELWRTVRARHRTGGLRLSRRAL